MLYPTICKQIKECCPAPTNLDPLHLLREVALVQDIGALARARDIAAQAESGSLDDRVVVDRVAAAGPGTDVPRAIDRGEGVRLDEDVQKNPNLTRRARGKESPGSTTTLRYQVEMYLKKKILINFVHDLTKDSLFFP